MDDLISRQAAVNETWREPRYTDALNALREIRERIRSLPSAQQEIIRCKDCVHADWSGLPEGMLYCMVHEHYLSEDDYCSYGMKEDG